MVEEFMRRLMEFVNSYEKLFNEFVSRLVREYPNVTVILFGSRARGDNEPSSDFDVAVIMSCGNRLKAASELYRLAPPIPIDIVVLYPEDLNDPVVNAMLKGGKLLHDGLNLRDRLRELGIT